MPTYALRCRCCNRHWDEYRPTFTPDGLPRDCPACGGPVVRRWTPPYVLRTGFVETHFNHTTGEIVHNQSEFRDQLKRKSDEASERTGIEHRFVPVDPDQPRALGVKLDGTEQFPVNEKAF
jgi:predicted nucleic acid-binding Zn ribbon protein